MKGISMDYREITPLETLMNDRKSIVRYLSPHFPNPRTLLESMLFSDVYLSGSRALDYFVPGSTSNDSDWDFYVGSDSTKIYSFMQFMESIGTRWITAAEWFEDRLNDGVSHGITEGQIEHLESIKDTLILDQVTRTAIEELSDATEQLHIGPHEIDGEHEVDVTVTNKYNNTKPFTIRKDEYAKFDIIYGQLTYHGKTHKIQLMTGCHRLHTILEFYMSAVQCVITGFCAAHMYASDTYKMKSSVWLSDDQSNITRQRTEWSKSKYKERGYTLYDIPVNEIDNPYQSQGIVKRSLRDSNSHVIDFNIYSDTRTKYSNVLDESANNYSNSIVDKDKIAMYISAKRRQFSAFKWIQNGNSLFSDTYDDYHMHECLNDSIRDYTERLIRRVYPHTSSTNANSLYSLSHRFINKHTILVEDVDKLINRHTVPEGYLIQYIPQP